VTTSRTRHHGCPMGHGTHEGQGRHAITVTATAAIVKTARTLTTVITTISITTPDTHGCRSTCETHERHGPLAMGAGRMQALAGQMAWVITAPSRLPGGGVAGVKQRHAPNQRPSPRSRRDCRHRNNAQQCHNTGVGHAPGDAHDCHG